LQQAEPVASRRAALASVAGVSLASLLAAPASQAAYGDAANVFGRVTNKSGKPIRTLAACARQGGRGLAPAAVGGDLAARAPARPAAFGAPAAAAAAAAGAAGMAAARRPTSCCAWGCGSSQLTARAAALPAPMGAGAPPPAAARAVSAAPC